MNKFDFWQDVYRLEQVLKRDYELGLNPPSVAFAICLTNDPSFWTEDKRGMLQVDEEFQTEPTRIVKANVPLRWYPYEEDNTYHSDAVQRPRILKLSDNYTCENIWHQYPIGNDATQNLNYPEFRFSIIEVKPYLND